MRNKYQNSLAVDWYRSPVDADILRRLNERSDLHGALQSLGYLALIATTGGAVLTAGTSQPLLLLPLLLLHGTFCAFSTNACHELVHGTVFRTQALNRLFLHLFAFIRWFPHDYYWASHTEHHKFTLHAPSDQEVVLPTRFSVRRFLACGFFDPARAVEILRFNLRFSRGRMEGEWENYVLGQDPARHKAFRWSRAMLVGHGSIALISVASGHWLVPVVVSMTPLYGGWLQQLCNDSQHAGMQDGVSDFRLNCRTMVLNPFLSFLYWHMNYHIEHHMYAAVPCYNLQRLHEVIRSDIPASPRGLWQAWRQILAIQRRQEADPGYRFDPALPSGSTGNRGATAEPPAEATIDPVSRDGSQAADRLWQCSICGFLYSERAGLPGDGIPPGTRWEDIPEDFVCPDCGTRKADFQMVEVRH